MVEVNQETVHYERMIGIKEKEILTIKDRMQDALKVQQDDDNALHRLMVGRCRCLLERSSIL